MDKDTEKSCVEREVQNSLKIYCNRFPLNKGGGFTGVLRRAEIGLFWVQKCGNQASFLQNTDSVFIRDPCG